MATPFLIGIAGASCSGKTTLAERLAAALGEAETIALDSYYHDLSHLAPEAVHGHNLDEPAALDFALLLEQVDALARGRSIDKPVYDHKTHRRAASPQRIVPGRFVILEGLFALYWEEVRERLGSGIFIDAKHAICLDRRIRRDRNQRGRTKEDTTRRYNEMVAPMFDRYVLPTREFADLVVDGEGTIDDALSRVLEHTRAAAVRHEGSDGSGRGPGGSGRGGEAPGREAVDE